MLVFYPIVNNILVAPRQTCTRDLNTDTSKEKEKIHTLLINEYKLLLAFEAEVCIMWVVLLYVF